MRALNRIFKGRGRDAQPLTLPKKVARLLKQKNAALHLPGEQTPVLGPELVTTGSSDMTGWSTTSPGSYAVTGGRIAITDAGGTAGIYRDIAVTAGKEYLFSADTEAVGGTGDMRAYVGGGFSTQLASTGLFTSRLTRPLKFIAQTSSIRLYIVEQGSTGTTCYAAGVSVREILSYSDTINGFRTGNYSDSVGTTPATIDGKTGLVVDAAGSVGPELLTSRDCSTAVAGSPGSLPLGWQGATPNLGLSRSVVAKTTDYVDIRLQGTTSATYCDFVQNFMPTSIPVSANEAYAVSFPGVTVVAGSLPSGGALNYSTVLMNSGTYVSQVTGVATSHVTQVPAAGVNQIRQAVVIAGYSSGVAVDVTLRVYTPSCKKLTGIHASQATDGYKPVERRGLVNLLTYSNDFSNVVWSKGAGIVPAVTGVAPWGSETTFTSAGGNPSVTQTKAGSIQSSLTYAFLVKKAGTRSYTQFAVRNDTTATVLAVATFTTATGIFSGITDSVQLDTDWYLGCLSVTSGISATDTVRVYAGSLGQTSPTGETYVIGSSALFQGTVTAQQIIDAGGIQVTTDAPKSSALGPRYWQFDGVDDRLQLSSVPFQMSDDHWVVVAARYDAIPSTSSLFAIRSSSSSVPIISKIGSNSGALIAHWRDDSGTLIQSDIGSQTIGERVVISARKSGNTVQARKNSGAFSSLTFSFGTTSVNQASVGCSIDVSASQFHNGQIYCVIYGKGAITDAELLLLEKFAGKLAGVQI